MPVKSFWHPHLSDEDTWVKELWMACSRSHNITKASFDSQAKAFFSAMMLQWGNDVWKGREPKGSRVLFPPYSTLHTYLTGWRCNDGAPWTTDKDIARVPPLLPHAPSWALLSMWLWLNLHHHYEERKRRRKWKRKGRRRRGREEGRKWQKKEETRAARYEDLDCRF